MVVFNYSGGEINAKVVYYGPALSGKTTNLEFIYEKMPSGVKGKMVSMKTRTDRTLFFDFLPLELGEINGYQTRILLYTVPGQVYYNATRKLVLKGADAVVFVADSSAAKMQENIDSLRNLEENLNELGLTLDTMPWVIQYNKRDLPDALPMDALNKKLNLLNVPSFEAVATTGDGLYETFQAIAGILYNRLSERLAKSQVKPGPGAMHPQPAAGSLRPAQTPPVPRPETTEPTSLSVSEVLDVALREVGSAEDPQSDAEPEESRPTEAETRRAETGEAPGDSPTGGNGPPFEFEPLEPPHRTSDDVGRVVDFGEEGPGELSRGDSAGEFVLDPFRADPTPPPPAKDESAGDPEPPPTDELVVTVPVVITRSQLRKTIPVKLCLDISVLEDTDT